MALGKLKLLDLLSPLYGRVMLPSAVYDEVVVRGFEKGFADSLQVELALQRNHLVVEQLTTSHEVSHLPLHKGEKAVLSLALRHEADLLLMDDMLAREQAQRMGFQVKGTLGVIVQAHRAGLLTLDELRIIIDTIALRNDIWIPETLCRRILSSLEGK